jgi:hypothetical protein
MKRFHRIAVQSLMVVGLAGLGAFAQDPVNPETPQTRQQTSPGQPTTSRDDQPQPTQDQTLPTQDNSTMTQHDPHTTGPAISSGRTDREVAAKVHQALMQDATLAADARNVKVTSQNGTVMLKGTVRSEEEKQAIETKAAEVSNGAKVVSSLSVVPSQK